MLKIKKLLKQVLRHLYYPLYRFAYKTVARKKEIVLSELDATDAIVQAAISSPEFIDRVLEHKPPFLAFDQETWNHYLRNMPGELKKLQGRLTANTDELSCEVVARYIERRLFCMEYGDNPAWNFLSCIHFRIKYPLDYETQKSLESLGKAYNCPYQLPFVWGVHMATSFSLNQFPLEVQQRVASKDIIDGGGFSGDSAMVFTEYNPKKVYTFEPNPNTIPVMMQIIAKNEVVLEEKRKRIVIVPLALGKSKGVLTLYSGGEHTVGEMDGGATTLPIGYGTRSHEVGVISIDEFVKEQHLDLGLIKLDIEGAELDSLCGPGNPELHFQRECRLFAAEVEHDA